MYGVSLILSIFLLSNSENREHLKILRNVDCVLENHNKVQDTRANLKTTIKGLFTWKWGTPDR